MSLKVSNGINMRKEQDILDDERLRQNPFSVPDGYVPELEEKVHRRIFAEEPLTPLAVFLARAKAPALLALTFCIIFAMGYGVLSLTGTAESQAVPSSGFADLMEQGYIHSDFIEDYYDHIHTETILEDTFAAMEMTSEMEEEIMRYITLNDIAEEYETSIE